MGVEIKISPLIQTLIGIAETVEVEGTSARECLDNLARENPGIKEVIFDKNGVMKVIILRNGIVLPQNCLDNEVSDKDIITILAPMAGG